MYLRCILGANQRVAGRAEEQLGESETKYEPMLGLPYTHFNLRGQWGPQGVPSARDVQVVTMSLASSIRLLVLWLDYGR